MNIDKIRGGLNVHSIVSKDVANMDLQNTRKKEWITYKKLVQHLTEKVKHSIPGIEARCFKTMHIDHKISIWYGFKHKLPASLIASLENLRMMPAKENMRKGIKCE